MKYMNFIQSCSYTALANMLLEFGVDTEDFDIALKINLPYIFQYNKGEKTYLAGARLQGEKWFNYYLNTLGLKFTEKAFLKDEVFLYLQSTNPFSMLGVYVGRSKHALIYQGMNQGSYTFLNPRYQEESSPDKYVFNEEELGLCLDHMTYIGRIERTNHIIPLNNTDEMVTSLTYLKMYKEEVRSFCHSLQQTDMLQSAMDKLFAAPFLHLVAMMHISQNTAIENRLIELRAQYLNAIRKNQALVLAKHMDYKAFENVLDDYVGLIHNVLEGEKR